jgi:hypothetical protein
VQARHGDTLLGSLIPTPVAIRGSECHTTMMSYEIDRTLPEDEGDGLPNMHLRLRAIMGSMIGGLAVWAAVISLIQITVR